MSARSRFIFAAGVVASVTAALIFFSISSSTAYYLTPGELLEGKSHGQRGDRKVRVAGKVVEGSVRREGPTTSFAVSDGQQQVDVVTRDVLPDTFGSGVEVVAEGAMTDRRVFSASSVLAKCPSKFKARISAL